MGLSSLQARRKRCISFSNKTKSATPLPLPQVLHHHHHTITTAAKPPSPPTHPSLAPDHNTADPDGNTNDLDRDEPQWRSIHLALRSHLLGLLIDHRSTIHRGMQGIDRQIEVRYAGDRSTVHELEEDQKELQLLPTPQPTPSSSRMNAAYASILMFLINWCRCLSRSASSDTNSVMTSSTMLSDDKFLPTEDVILASSYSILDLHHTVHT